ncbi:amidohydrolase family protein [Aggregatimonas sangjinii]|uniref:Amidohydrolase family protein n=1 Tax=Aggregatimonas sangjinii TaxID=2583587 RepID=A0A5B7SU68_9FLAO|nr:amidohydrolase family protein [Aggregatimonas sangjinii]QCX01692.1 amidohydrolase family protein [Aggregatimonas sangjinii]
MKRPAIFLSTTLCLLFCLTSCSQTSDYDLAVENVSVFDSKNKTVLANRTILMNADTIARIIGASEKFVANETIDGKGRLATSGFIDTHTHLMQNYTNSSDFAPETIEGDQREVARGLMAHMYLAYGITTIIDMGQPEAWMDVTLNWQKNPSPEFPNLFICGGSIVSDEDRRQPQHHIEVMGPEDGRKKVRAYAEKGIKHMKLYRKLRKPDMEAMADEAKKYDITINTHTDNNVVTIDEAMEMGILNFEHFFTVTPSILNYDIHWKAMNEKYGIQMNSSIDEFAAHMVFFFSYIRENPEFEAKLEALFGRMAAKGASLSTALNVLASPAGKTDFFTSFEYFPIRRTPMVSYSDAQQKQLDSAFEGMLFYIKKAHDQGVKLRIGTDCRYGGRAMLHELMLFHDAGIPMEDILQIATLNGYESMKLDQEYGTIEVGKKADFLLFDQNPFDDPRNLLSEKTIVKGGKLVTLKKSLAYVLQDRIIDEGVDKGLTWFNKNKDTKTFGPLNPGELENVISTFIGDGRVAEAKAVLGLFTANFPERKVTIDGTLLTNGTYARLREKEYRDAITLYEFGRNNFPEADKTLPLAVLITMLKEGIVEAEKYHNVIKDDTAYIFNENEMNGVGYLLLQLEKPKEAIAIFRLNVEAFPDSWNVYDSLGEAYMIDGQKTLAIDNYRKSITLNPENEHGKNQLEKLGAR